MIRTYALNVQQLFFRKDVNYTVGTKAGAHSLDASLGAHRILRNIQTPTAACSSVGDRFNCRLFGTRHPIVHEQVHGVVVRLHTPPLTTGTSSERLALSEMKSETE